jgi:iron(III) transport system substrate-binding protein
MKKILAVLLALVLALGCCSIAMADAADPEALSELLCGDDSLVDLIEEAQEEGELVVYGSCEEAYLAAASKHFEEITGIKVSYQRLSTGEVQGKIAEENHNPSGDVWFGGTNDPYNESAKNGFLYAYEAVNAKNLSKATFRDADGYWYGIYKGILGFMVNTEELAKKGLEAPTGWDSLLDEKYQGLIWSSNPNTAGTARLIVNTMIQMKGHDEGIAYLVALDKNIAQYTKSGSGPSKYVGPGECVIGIGFLHDGITQILKGYDNIALVIPEEGTSYEIGSTAIFDGAAHEAAAKLWIEYALSPECVELADDAESYQFLVISNAEQPAAVAPFGLDPDNVIDYDFADAKANTTKYVAEFFAALADAADDRFKTE